MCSCRSPREPQTVSPARPPVPRPAGRLPRRRPTRRAQPRRRRSATPPTEGSRPLPLLSPTSGLPWMGASGTLAGCEPARKSSRGQIRLAPWPLPSPRRECSTSRISAARPAAACRAWCSTTSTAAPSASARCGENCRAFDDILFRPRSAVATRQIDLATTVLGTSIDLPFMLAPVGSSRLFWPRGEEEAARAAGAAGTGYILSTLSGCRLEDVRAADAGAGLVSALPRRRPRRRARRPSPARRRRDTARWSSPSTRRSRDCASATSATASRNCSRGARCRCCPTSGSCSRARAGWRAIFGDGGLMSSPTSSSPRGRWPMPTSARRSKRRWCRGTTSRGFARPGAARSW